MRSMTITELVTTFRRSLLALTPIADRTRLSWDFREAHDDWDHLAECLYEVFVARPVLTDSRAPREAHPMPRYAAHIDSYRAYRCPSLAAPDRTTTRVPSSLQMPTR
ncbi:hypothetical protein LX15_003677 [Streptoalloteichus tenebrarius]|uniref:Uncharacterized protein n=1 Tax=Streptoalloteichus tenebrarius (strain ATCC 17920 / DSM 40477 / JCM 4838 / CBS 697.72 / NBRC 16177 / NCIMB 11028 / NRRL B-12390 / A12253. 1 / ISP 5477) TaxID=1933 RepID=A0ABT1HWR8_STRSD|nr:hypothetical protein [Streptoalloteichus tenebrarius]BFF03925.1 hypothetical protein GCM10020241_56000 [Streptoalloteichus tenebrarius]